MLAAVAIETQYNPNKSVENKVVWREEGCLYVSDFYRNFCVSYRVMTGVDGILGRKAPCLPGTVLRVLREVGQQVACWVRREEDCRYVTDFHLHFFVIMAWGVCILGRRTLCLPGTSLRMLREVDLQVGMHVQSAVPVHGTADRPDGAYAKFLSCKIILPNFIPFNC